MFNQEISEEKQQSKSMSSDERKVLIRNKMKVDGLVEGSGVLEKNLLSYEGARYGSGLF